MAMKPQNQRRYQDNGEVLRLFLEEAGLTNTVIPLKKKYLIRVNPGFPSKLSNSGGVGKRARARARHPMPKFAKPVK